MQEPFDEEDENNRLRIENEIKKFKLSVEHGANFLSSSEKKLPPQLEGQWLDHVQQFEDAYTNSKRVLVYNFIGKPTYKSSIEVSETEIKSELKKLIKLLSQNGIKINTIYEVDDRVFYHFITAELFKEEIDDVTLEGMTHNFIYEEFHPNHENDIKSTCKEFVERLLDKNKNLNFIVFTNEIEAKDGIINQEDAIKKLELFRDAFTSFKLDDFKITSFNMNADQADVFFDIDFTVTIEGNNELAKFSGMGNFRLKYEYDYWCFNKITIPGIFL